MIVDYEDTILEGLAQAMEEFDPSINMLSTLDTGESSLPACWARESANDTYVRGIDTSTLENYRSLEYKVDIFTNDIPGSITMIPKKRRNKQLMEVVHNYFTELGFLNVSPTGELPNYANPTTYRRQATYRAIVDARGKLYTS